MTCKTSRRRQASVRVRKTAQRTSPFLGGPPRGGTALLAGDDAAVGAILVVSASLRRRLEE
jgi:hypothetical protein